MLLLLSGTAWTVNQSWAAESDAPRDQSIPTDKMTAVQVLERDSRKPLVGLSVEVVATKEIWCFKAPCPLGKEKKWMGVTDANGVLRFPANLGEVNDDVSFHAVGTDSYGSVHRQSKYNTQGNAIIFLTRPHPKAGVRR